MHIRNGAKFKGDKLMAGFFTKPLTPETPAQPPALSQDRIKAVLDADNLNYGIDSDGDLGGWWDGHLFYFFLMGEQNEILTVRARWNREVPQENWTQMLEFMNQQHTERLFPRIAMLRDDNGTINVFAQHCVDYEHGVTDAQLHLHFQTAISSTLRFFELLDEQYPDAVAAANAANES